MTYTFAESSFESKRGVAIYTREYIPTSDDFSTVFLFLHGVGEHCSRFHAFFEHLANQPMAVFAMDHHGHGKSGGERFDIDRFESFTEDIQQYTAAIRTRFLNKSVKFVVGGISFGGLLAASVATMNDHVWDGVLLLAPAIGIEMNGVLKVQQSMAPLINRLVPTWKLVPAVILEHLSRNPDFVKDYDSDELNSRGNLRVRLAFEISRGMEMLKAREAALTAPLLILHGDKDVVTSPRLSKEFFDRVPSTKKTYASLPGQFHCIINEPERDDNLALMTDWIQRL
ncbi:hypothetical protein SPRG_07913 [Saprolegnia parasitica CBS 223.65]|uniref:Serine aminopeptidase S33 domain-containing protein n=1 Tax=Saprolegnia parasitica (strain CBS 223.65) TaxID=695850 RepID=A0A067CBE7_SAPPC|nr:hypothetical protein SPRG_07913 [Saprolegnia parasitica CBS 223.65]KDO26510.1 hypothetical protein SPRG_07913 [Saprolegnia parasitica CBS 223.65]|eukprot:XP_012202655.1 hypothetical protein SPRG_07913 [Saprolegnia parasitica CBS 223.65]